MMLMQVLLATVLLLGIETNSQSRVTANISNIKNDKGICRACIFNNEASFKKNTAFQCLQVKVDNKTAQAQFENIPDGTYAIFVFHDANANNKMDKNFLGIPSEGYGASRNNLPFAAAPTFEDNKFTVSRDIIIRLRSGCVTCKHCEKPLCPVF
jgi:uncharacterized protein (DUF2141 family)